MSLPTGAGSSATARSASAMASSRASVRRRRSWKAAVMPLARAFSMSMALAARISSRRSRTAWAAPIRAAYLRSALVEARTRAAFRARRPSSSISAEISMASAEFMACLLLGAKQHHIVPMHHLGAVPHAQKVLAEIAALAHDEPRIFAVETGESPGDLPSLRIDNGDGIATLKSTGNARNPDRQQRTALPEGAGGPCIDLKGARHRKRPHDPAFSRLGPGCRGQEEGVCSGVHQSPQGVIFSALG